MPKTKNGGVSPTRNGRTQASQSTPPGGTRMRTTLLISQEIDRMVEVYAAMAQRQKSDIVNEALEQYLSHKEELRPLSRG